MDFANPYFLLALVALPLLARWLHRPGERRSSALRYSEVRVLPGEPLTRAALARAVPWLGLVALGFLVVGMARPRSLQEVTPLSAEGIDIVLVFDISGSMQARDFRPRDRFTVAKGVLQDFIAGSEGDRLALVVFAAKAFTQCPLTLDYEVLQGLLKQVEIGMVDDGTAIGMAIATAASRLARSESKSRIIILLTDGENNMGQIDPVTAAKAAGALGIKIYAVGVGSKRGALVRTREGMFIAKLDEETLQRVAALSNGKYFRAADPNALERIYAEIRKLEKSKFEIEEYRRYEELAGRFLWWGASLLGLQVLLSCTWLRKVP